MAVALIIVLALAGLGISAYFALAYYGRMKKSRWVPEILCARPGSSCVSVARTPYGRVFGVPNSLLGVLYYLLLIAWALTDRSTDLSFRVGAADYVLGVGNLLLALSAVTVAFGFYLIYALRRVLHTACPLCYTAHAINAVLLVLLIWLVR